MIQQYSRKIFNERYVLIDVTPLPSDMTIYAVYYDKESPDRLYREKIFFIGKVRKQLRCNKNNNNVDPETSDYFRNNGMWRDQDKDPVMLFLTTDLECLGYFNNLDIPEESNNFMGFETSETKNWDIDLQFFEKTKKDGT